MAEAYTPKRPDILAEYTRPDEFHQCFAFDLLLAPWHGDVVAHARSPRRSPSGEAQGAWPTLTLNNHDTQRTVTRYGRESNTTPDAWTGDNQHYPPGPVDLAVGTRRARAAAGLLLAMPGAVYLYMGEELGLPEVLDLPDEAREDPVFFRTGGAQIGRDGCRVPMPWTTAPGRRVRLLAAGHDRRPVDATAGRLGRRTPSAAQDDDPASVLALYRRLIAARRELLGASERRARSRSTTTSSRSAAATSSSPATWGASRVPCVAAAGLDAVLTTGDDADGTTVPADTTVWFAPAARSLGSQPWSSPASSPT